MIPQRDLLAVSSEMERRRKDIAWAEKERLVRRVIKRNAPSSNGYQHWLARLGAQLETWGTHLQARYDESLSISGAAQQES
jgi:hypothetical protein